MKKIFLVLICLVTFNLQSVFAIDYYSSNKNHKTYIDFYNSKSESRFVLMPNGTSSFSVDRLLKGLKSLKVEGTSLQFSKIEEINTNLQPTFKKLYQVLCESRNKCGTNINVTFKEADEYLSKKEKSLLAQYYIAREFLIIIQSILESRSILGEVPEVQDYINNVRDFIDILDIDGKSIVFSPKKPKNIIGIIKIKTNKLSKQPSKYVLNIIKGRLKNKILSLFKGYIEKGFKKAVEDDINKRLLGNLNNSIKQFESNLGSYYLKTLSFNFFNELNNHNFKDMVKINNWKLFKKALGESVKQTDTMLDIPSLETRGIIDIKDIAVVKGMSLAFKAGGVASFYNSVNEYENFIKNYTELSWISDKLFSKQIVRPIFDYKSIDSIIERYQKFDFGTQIIYPRQVCDINNKCKEVSLNSGLHGEISTYIKEHCFYSDGGNPFIFDEKNCPKKLFIGGDNKTLQEYIVTNSKLSKMFNKNLSNLDNREILIDKYLIIKDKKSDEDVNKNLNTKNKKGATCFHTKSYPNSEEVEIYSYDFKNCSENLEIPNFQGKKINSFRLEEGTNLGKNKLKSIKTGDSLRWIEFQIFANYGIEKLELGKNIEKLVDESFKNNNIEEVTLPKSLGKYGIGKEVFMDNKLKKVVFENGGKLLLIGDRSFKNNNIESIIFSDSITSIGTESFMNNKLTKINLPSQLNIIYQKSFMNNDLEVVKFPATVTNIGFSAFENNNLKEITFSSPVNISINAFSNNNLTGVKLLKNSYLTIEDGKFPFAKNCIKKENLDETTLKIFNKYRDWEKTQKSDNECKNSKKQEVVKEKENYTLSTSMKKNIDIILDKKVFNKYSKEKLDNIYRVLKNLDISKFANNKQKLAIINYLKESFEKKYKQNFGK